MHIHEKNNSALIEYINMFCRLCCLVVFQDGFNFIVDVVITVGVVDTEVCKFVLKKKKIGQLTMWRLYKIFNIPCIFCHGWLIKYALHAMPFNIFHTISISFFPSSIQAYTASVYFVFSSKHFFVFMCALNTHSSHFLYCEYISKAVTKVGKMKKKKEKYVEWKSEYAFKVFSSWWLLWHGGSWGFKSFIFSFDIIDILGNKQIILSAQQQQTWNPSRQTVLELEYQTNKDKTKENKKEIKRRWNKGKQFCLVGQMVVIFQARQSERMRR